MKNIIIVIFLTISSTIFSQTKEDDIRSAGQSIEKAGVNLVEHINDSVRNTAMIIAGNYLLLDGKSIGLGSGLVLCGVLFESLNIFKIKTAGKNLIKAGKLLKAK